MRNFINRTPQPNIIYWNKPIRMRWVGHVARMVERRDAYVVLVGRPDGKRILGRPRHRWANIKVLFLD
jgi:hypothetical protein